MITVRIEVKLHNGITIEYEEEAFGVVGRNGKLDAEKAQAVLLEGYHKVHKGIESQK